MKLTYPTQALNKFILLILVTLLTACESFQLTNKQFNPLLGNWKSDKELTLAFIHKNKNISKKAS